MAFDKRISIGNLATIITMIVLAAAQWGAFESTIGAIEKRLSDVEALQVEFRKDTRVVEALNRIAVIENNVLWIRSDTADIKAQLKKGAQ
jgi:hypothetical protein